MYMKLLRMYKTCVYSIYKTAAVSSILCVFKVGLLQSFMQLPFLSLRCWVDDRYPPKTYILKFFKGLLEEILLRDKLVH